MTDRFKTVYSKGDNFVIDNNDNKIGINKASPEESLDVSGNIKFSGEIIGNINYNNLTNKPTTITTAQASAIEANTAKTSFPGFGTSAGTALQGNTTTITTAQASAIGANTAKLQGIANGAEVNVQADWDITDTNSDAYIKNKPTNVSEFTNDSGYATESYVDSEIANLVSTAPTHLDTLKELADAIVDTSDNKIVALTTSISEKLSTSHAQATYATISSVTTELNGKQNTLIAGTNITITADGTISAQAGTTINSLNDIANVDVDSKSNGQVLKWNGSKWTAQADNDTSYTLPVATQNNIGGVKPGANITIASDGTISAQAGTTINSLNDIADVNVDSKSNGQVLKWNGSKWTAQADNDTSYTLPVATQNNIGGVKPGANITIASDGTISAQAGTTINSLNDIADVNVGVNIQDGYVLKWNGSKWTAQNDIVGSGGGGGSGGGSGNGVTLVPTTADQSDLSGNRPYPNLHSGTGTEGDIIYDVSKNKFYEASNSKEDNQTGGEVKFRPLGYSFFAENMQGQPPSPDPNSFFFFLTSKTIVIKWTNPTQFHTGLTGPKGTTSMPLDNTSPIVTDPDLTTGGQIWFPIVNRIMIQIKNLDDGSYQTWGTRESENPAAKSSTPNSYPFPNARVICEKAKVIPPAPTNNGNITSNITYTDTGTTREKVHKLSEFANSIILYKDANVPTNLEEDSAGNKIALKDKRVYNPPGNKDQNLTFSIPDSILGYEIKIWLENQYYNGTASSPSLTEYDLNVVTLNKITRKMDENGDEIDTYVPNSEPITFQKVLPPTELYVADYKSTDGFHVEVGRIPDTTIHYLECIIPKHTKISDGGDYTALTPLTTATSGQENDVFFKGYFIEYQTIPADVTYSSNTVNDIASAFVSGTSGFEDWKYIKFHTIGTTFTHNDSNSSDNTDLATDEDAKVLSSNVGKDIDWTGAVNPQTNNIYGDGFISAGRVISGAFDTKTLDIDYSVSKAFLLPQGDNKFYRFRIRGLNTGNKKPGPPSTKYAYFIFNKPAPIYWNTPTPKFIPAQNKWSIRLTWKNTDNNATTPGPYYSSMAVTNGAKKYQPNEIAIMEYKLERRDTTVDTDNTAWRTISYWANTKKTISTSASNGLDITHDYQIWPTPLRTKDTNYADYTVTTNNVVEKISNGWVQGNVSNEYAEWNQATSANSSVYTVEARLMAAGRNPTFQFRIQARNYLYGKREDSSGLENTEKQWLKETDITDTRWSDHSSASTDLVTTAHTYDTTTSTGYTPSLQDNANNNDKYEIKFYQQNSADDKSPWNGNHTDYHSSDRPVNYTIANNNVNSTSNTRFLSSSFTNNTVPTVDYIAYQWKLSETNTTVDSTTGLTIDRYEIEETIKMGTSATDTSEATTKPKTIIYSPNFEYGPANWHINKYTPFITDSPSFKFKVRAFNFFNSTASNYSSDSTTLKPTKPSQPQFLSSDATSAKENSDPTFALTDDGITILVDEPAFTGQTTSSTNYQNQAISIKEFKLEKVLLDSATTSPTGEINLINSHNNTLRKDDDIQGDESQVATFFHPNGYTNNTALKDLNTGKVTYTFYAKNVLNTSFSDTRSCTLTIGKPNPGENFKYCPKFTWIKSTNKVQLEFFRMATISNTSTEILKDGATSTIALHSAMTSGCNVTNEIKKLQWNVKCSGAPASGTNIITTSYGDVGTPTGYNTNGDNATTVAYTISNTGIETWSKDTAHQIRYRVKNQYNAGWFEDPQASNYCEIKLTAPNTIGGISSVVTYALEDGNNNILQIDWTKPTEYGLHYKHEGGTLTAQTQPNIKKYKVYFNDGALWYVYTRTASSQDDADKDLTITSGTTVVEKWSNSARNTGYVESHTIRIRPEKTYTIEKITAINWLYDSESPAQASATATTYSNGDRIYPPINGSKTVTNTNAPKPKVFSNYKNKGILISAGSTARTVKILGDKDYGIALTNVLLNAANVKGTSSIMGIKIKVTDIGNSNTATYSTECKFHSDDIVSGHSLTLTYTWVVNSTSTTKNLAEITMGSYKDLYKDATSATDNKTYWFINESIKLKWLGNASEISDFYGKNLKFSTVVTYYDASGNANIVVTRKIEEGYYDKTIENPSDLSITPSYTPFTCLGLPILESSDTLTVTTSFDNKSEHWVASSAVNTITLGSNVASVTTSKTDHSYSGSTITLTDKDMGNYSGSSLKKDAQIKVIAKNCNGTANLTHSSKYIYDPSSVALINIINSQNLTTDHIKVSSGSATGNAAAGVVEMNVLKVPDDFNPTDKNEFNAEILDVTKATVVGRNRLIIYDGKFCSAAYFKQQFGTSTDNYHSNVKTVLDDQTTDAKNGGKFYVPGGSTTDTLKDDFRWQIFSMRYKNTSGGGVPIGNFVISLGSSTNITENHLKKFSDGSGNLDFEADSTSDVEIWIKYIRSAGDGLSKEESRWNKLIQNNINYVGASHGAINQPWNGIDSSKARTSSWVGGGLTGTNKNLKIQFAQKKTAFTAVWDFFIAIGMRNNNNVKTFIEIPKTIGALTD